MENVIWQSMQEWEMEGGESSEVEKGKGTVEGKEIGNVAHQTGTGNS